MEILRNRLIALMEARQINQAELERRAHVKKGRVHDALAKSKAPSIDLVVGVARALNVSTDYLLGLSDKLDTEQPAAAQAAANVQAHLVPLVEDLRKELESFDWRSVRALREALVDTGDALAALGKLLEVQRAHLAQIVEKVEEFAGERAKPRAADGKNSDRVVRDVQYAWRGKDVVWQGLLHETLTVK